MKTRQEKIVISAAMSILGRKKSTKKANAARANAKKGRKAFLANYKAKKS